MPHAARSPRVRRALWSCALLCVVLAVSWSARPVRAAASRRAGGGALVTRDERTDTWTIDTGSASLALGFDRRGNLVLYGFGAGGSGILLPELDASIVLNGHEVVLGDRKDDGVFFAGDRTEDYHGGVRLTLAFNVPDESARIDRHFVAYPVRPSSRPGSRSSGSMETCPWTPPVSPRGGSGSRAARCTGCAGWTCWIALDLAFAGETRALADGESLTLDAAGRSTQSSMPWMTLATPQGTFFGGLLWSGAWRILAQGVPDGTDVVAGLDDVQTRVPAGRSLEGVHGFFGVVLRRCHGCRRRPCGRS